MLIASLRNQQEIIKGSLKDPDIRTPEVRSALMKSILDLEDQIREISIAGDLGGTRMHKKGGAVKKKRGGAVMKKRGGTFKGVF